MYSILTQRRFFKSSQASFFGDDFWARGQVWINRNHEASIKLIQTQKYSG
jgi:hypothetical protein